MFDTLCTDHVFQAAPWLGLFLAWFVAVQLTSRMVAELLFAVARVCGLAKTSLVAKIVGKVAWELARLFAALGWGTPRRYREVLVGREQRFLADWIDGQDGDK